MKNQIASKLVLYSNRKGLDLILPVAFLLETFQQLRKY